MCPYHPVAIPGASSTDQPPCLLPAMFFSPSDKQINHFYLSCPVQDGPARRRRTTRVLGLFWGVVPSKSVFPVSRPLPPTRRCQGMDVPCLWPHGIVGTRRPLSRWRVERWLDLLMLCLALKLFQRCTQMSNNVWHPGENFVRKSLPTNAINTPAVLPLLDT